jgi:hypothetical protein
MIFGLLDILMGYFLYSKPSGQILTFHFEFHIWLQSGRAQRCAFKKLKQMGIIKKIVHINIVGANKQHIKKILIRKFQT